MKIKEVKTKELAVYSVITGGYDQILPVKSIDERCDYFIISNEYIDLPAPWKLLTPPKKNLNNKDFNRFYKLNPHLVFPDYKYSLYIDGNILLCGDIFEWSSSQLSKSDFSIFSHPERDNIFDEGKICSFIGTDYFWIINRQLRKYKKENFCHDALYEANILLRSHNEPKVIELMEKWWLEYIDKFNAKRDQLALPYVIWRTEFRVNNMGPSDARYENKYFRYMGHANNRHKTLETKFKKIINRTIGSLFNV
ncbi:glycosyltransferase domain-containing protein [Erwinia oleae]|uniref:glycosyltransferase domain-containing protein n=1 Tax=Erwinia oleae TaxID=796334 RepID=UPI00068CA1AF|nr:glycosyltransferase domain-containing protein [Erwinia oleae]